MAQAIHTFATLALSFCLGGLIGFGLGRIKNAAKLAAVNTELLAIKMETEKTAGLTAAWMGQKVDALLKKL